MESGDACSDDQSLMGRNISNESEGFKKIRKYLDSSRSSKPTMTKARAGIVLMSFSFGSAVIVLPNTVYLLGPSIWTLVVVSSVAVIGYCTYLNSMSTLLFISENRTEDAVRDPYPAIAEMAAGDTFRKITIFAMHVTMTTNAFGYMILGATLLNDVLPFGGVDYYNSVRIWCVIASFVVSPFMYFRTIADLSHVAVFAIIASIISALGVFINCILLKFRYSVKPDSYFATSTADEYTKEFCIIYGLVMFATSGPSIVIPSVISQVDDISNFPTTILTVFSCIFLIYVLAGSVPNAVLGNLASSHVTGTFKTLNYLFHGELAVPLLTSLTCVGMSLHFFSEAVITIIPVYQHIEEVMGIPRKLNWKRIGVRSGGILFISVICIAFPTFRMVLSIVGGLPLSLVGIVFPLFIYTRLFEVGTVRKVIHGIIAFVVGLVMIGNLCVSANMLVHSALVSLTETNPKLYGELKAVNQTACPTCNLTVIP